MSAAIENVIALVSAFHALVDACIDSGIYELDEVEVIPLSMESLFRADKPLVQGSSFYMMHAAFQAGLLQFLKAYDNTSDCAKEYSRAAKKAAATWTWEPVLVLPETGTTVALLQPLRVGDLPFVNITDDPVTLTWQLDKCDQKYSKIDELPGDKWRAWPKWNDHVEHMNSKIVIAEETLQRSRFSSDTDSCESDAETEPIRPTKRPRPQVTGETV